MRLGGPSSIPTLGKSKKSNIQKVFPPSPHKAEHWQMEPGMINYVIEQLHVIKKY